MGREMNPQHCLFQRGSYKASPNTWFFEHTRIRTPNGILIGSAVLAQLMVVTDRQTQTHTHTDHATSATIDRIYAVHACDAT